MRARSQRTHLMGQSNRINAESLQKTKSIHERSFNKSSILQSTTKKTSSDLSQKIGQNLGSLNKSTLLRSNRQNPFNGTNVQLQSSRFDKMNIKKNQNLQKQKIKPRAPFKDYSQKVNENIKDLKKNFVGKNVNTHKIFMLKQTILKNNRDRVNFEEYYNRFAKNNPHSKINQAGIKEFIKSFGYDLNSAEVNLLLKLSQTQKNPTNISPQNQAIELDMKDFIELCTKDNVYYKTIDLRQQDGSKLSHKAFIPRHFEILRNKFSRLKEAFKIYTTRNQQITYDDFTYTMKKLDINDLIMPKKERDQLFARFSNEKGNFSSEKMLAAIAAHYHEEAHQLKEKTGFQANLTYVQEQSAQKGHTKEPKYNLKKTSVVQYQNHLENARTILTHLRTLLKSENAQQNQIKKLTNGETVTKTQLRKKIESYLMNKGYSFRSDKYDSLMGYLDFDSKGNIGTQQLETFLIKETNKEAEDRFQRQIRNLPPINKRKEISTEDLNIQQAMQTLKSLKSQTLNPEVNSFFSSFDKDRDGYISIEQFKSRIKDIMPKQSQQNISNLVGYFYADGESYLKRKQFVDRYNKDDQYYEQKQVTKSKSIFEYNDLRKSSINSMFKSAHYQRPTKYSAWPSHLNENNLSLIQAPLNSSVYIDEHHRFNTNQKNSYGIEDKLERQKRKNVKIAKLAAWKKQHQQQLQKSRDNEQNRQEDKNFAVRLVREQYNKYLHENYE